MGYATNLYLDSVPCFFDYGHMLFLCCVNSIFPSFSSWADCSTQALLPSDKNLDDVSTYLTFVNFHSFCHDEPPLICYVNLSGACIAPLQPRATRKRVTILPLPSSTCSLVHLSFSPPSSSFTLPLKRYALTLIDDHNRNEYQRNNKHDLQ